MVIFLTGILAGIVSGIAMGGGIVLVTILSHLTKIPQVGLQGINLIYYVLTATFSLYVYRKDKNIDYKISRQIIFWGLLPTVIGAVVANNITTEILKKLFGFYVIVVGIIMLKKK
ncbi:MAG: sulfite exporter TauE/SafE family protein [Clostridia bacterium]|nr:sulfite exporter TauE/SafE family protein [Clostridia bacterium]